MTIICILLQGYSIPNEYIAAQGKVVVVVVVGVVVVVVVVVVVIVVVVVVIVAASFHLLSCRSCAKFCV